ncbi:MAG: ferric reductase-like transmembrane domain-containing protein [Desulfofustis sp.]|nr:ferric reductase-like transmembrane domain-containing protein [Desulfofustis sp.]
MSTPSTSYPSSEFRAAIYRVLLTSSLLLLLSVVMLIPTYYQTTTLWYKTGTDRVMLFAAQYIGLAALVLLYLQAILSARGKFLDQVFGAAMLLKLHRLNGVLLLVLAASHILLVLVPEGLANLPLGKKFWPEMVGGALFIFIALLVVFSFFREAIRLPYKTWRFLHRPAGYLTLGLVTVHVMFVSDSFEQAVPRILLLALFILTVLWMVGVKFIFNRKVSNSS